MITFFIHPRWRRTDIPHIPLLYPSWGTPLIHRTPFLESLFEHYSFDTRLYSITDDVKAADMVLMPYSHRTALVRCPDLIEECRETALALDIPFLIDGTGDIEYPVDAQNALVLRYGGYRFARKPNEIHIPLYADDLLERFCGGDIHIRKKTQKPTVGFAGWTSLTQFQKIKTTLKEIPTRSRCLFDNRYCAYRKGIFFRQRAISELKQSELVELNSIERGSYSGHQSTAEKESHMLRSEFVQNLLQSDYGLDVRGDANASARLFEILSLGRIPIIIDTERNFPFSEKIDYRSFSFIIDFRDLDELPERLAEFHTGLTEETFENMQKMARYTYQNYFRVDAMTTHIVEKLYQHLDRTRSQTYVE